MSGYEDEHNITRPTTTSEPSHPRRPDLSSFFSALDLTTPAPTSHTSPEPLPGNVSAAFRMLANALQVMSGETTGVAIDHNFGGAHPDTNLLDGMISSLMASAEAPPRAVEGMPDEWFDGLERVDKKELMRMGEDKACPICGVPFLEDKYPLVVRLPCHKDHTFDLECIRPWLKLKTTCPLDRVDLKPKKKEVPKEVVKDDEEEEYDDMYA